MVKKKTKPKNQTKPNPNTPKTKQLKGQQAEKCTKHVWGPV